MSPLENSPLRAEQHVLDFDLRGWKSWREQIQNLLDDSIGHRSTKYKDYNPFKFSVGAVTGALKRVSRYPCPLFTCISDHNEILHHRIYLIFHEPLIRVSSYFDRVFFSPFENMNWMK